MMLNAAWYAVAVRSNFERIVAQSLRQKDYEVFLPTYLAKRRWSDRTKVVECALFPGYLFCRMDLQQPEARPNEGEPESPPAINRTNWPACSKVAAINV